MSRYLQGRARFNEAEPLIRRALAIDEQSYGAEHPEVAIDLNNLALLLQATNRLDEALPLMERSVAIYRHFAQTNGYQHPHWENVTGYFDRCGLRCGWTTRWTTRAARQSRSQRGSD